MDQRNVALFLADFDHQVAQIRDIYSILENKSATLSSGKSSSETIESIGYWLHNLYSACEDLFKLVAGFWENSIDSDRTFHKDLIKRMVLVIEGIRPSLLSEESFRYLNELRGFRHVFRHAYSYGLDDERVIYLLKRMKLNVPGFRPKVIDEELYALLDDFRAFRHKFRHSYSFELDWEREKLLII